MQVSQPPTPPLNRMYDLDLRSHEPHRHDRISQSMGLRWGPRGLSIVRSAGPSGYSTKSSGSEGCNDLEPCSCMRLCPNPPPPTHTPKSQHIWRFTEQPCTRNDFQEQIPPAMQCARTRHTGLFPLTYCKSPRVTSCPGTSSTGALSSSTFDESTPAHVCVLAQINSGHGQMARFNRNF